MTNSPSLDQLKQALALKEQIAGLENELAAILGVAATASIIPAPVPYRLDRPPGKGGTSEEGRSVARLAQR